MAPPLRVTERVDYALKAILLLALHDGEYLTTQAIAERYGISPKMLGSVLPALCQAGLLDSRAGWHGGFRLARPPSEITVASVIAAAVGPRLLAHARDAHAVLGAVPTATIDLASASRPGALTEAFWSALDEYVQAKLANVTAAHLLAEGF